MVRKYSFDCPACGMPDSVQVTTWNDPGTRDDPPDAGWDVVTRCSCEMTEEQVKALMTTLVGQDPPDDPDFDPDECRPTEGDIGGDPAVMKRVEKVMARATKVTRDRYVRVVKANGEPEGMGYVADQVIVHLTQAQGNRGLKKATVLSECLTRRVRDLEGGGDGNR